MFGKRINEVISRPSGELLERFRKYATPDICDAQIVYDAMDPRIKPWIGNGTVIGPAFTVKVPDGEGDIVAKAIDMAQEGDVIVVAGHGNCTVSYWGDKRSVKAYKKGIAGVVVDGAFRDFADCEKVGFPVFAKGLTMPTALKTGRGEINVPVSCGGVVVNPGDIVMGDVNGVCVIAAEYAEEILETLEGRRS